MKTVHSLSDLKQVKAVADHLRLRVLEAFIQGPATTKQVATQLGENVTRLYHHVQILEEAGLIRLVEERRKRGTVEKYYRAVAEDFIVNREVLEVSQKRGRPTRGYESLFLTALEATLAEAQRSVAARLIQPVREGRNALVYRHHVRGSKEEIAELMAKVQEWIAECRRAERGRGEVRYGIAIAFYPVRARQGKRTGPNKKSRHAR